MTIVNMLQQALAGSVPALCLAATLLLPLSACDDQLDIVPKGKVTLETIDELELLLNQEYKMEDYPADNLGIVSGETVGMFDQVTTVLSQTNTVKYALMTGSEEVDRATLTTSDQRYNSIYRYVNYMNVIISKMPDAVGDDSRRAPLIAEAKVMRAYLHWLAVNIYAHQYDSDAAAASEGGVAYATTPDVTLLNEKLTLADTYRMILDDVSDEVISQLPEDHGDQVMRGDRAWGNAVRAVVLMQMKRYAEALPYAQEAIRLRPQMFDRSVIKTTGEWNQPQTSANNFVYMAGAAPIAPTMVMITQATDRMFEPGDYVINYDTSSSWSLEYGKMYSGLDNIKMYMGWSTMCNVYGLTSEQLHYVAAECLIRTGRLTDGLELVDRVRALRVEDYDHYADLANPSEADAMELLQRAKWVECIGTPFNFFDIKRWNTEDGYRRTVTHRLGSLGTYTIAPESAIWVQPFPANAVRYNPTLTQNY